MERARGITIQSAAITFHWPPENSASAPEDAKGSIPRPSQLPSHTINLIDTPGHSDFTFEVVRSLRVLDGAICILDGVAGVEGQTEKVWHQASLYRIPMIIYVNKLDREGAAFGRSVKEIGERLMGHPAVCQIPWWEGSEGHFVGVGDVVRLSGLKWKDGGDGKVFEVFSLAELEGQNSSLAEELKKARVALVELLSEHDEQIIELFDQYHDHLNIPADRITESMRRCLLTGEGKVIPVFAGSSFRNMGVQPLLDAAVNLLPCPTERPDPTISMGSTKGGLNELLGGTLAIARPQGSKAKKAVEKMSEEQTRALTQNVEGCALAFKVVHDARRGVLVYIRVYSGVINRGTPLYNTNLHVAERPARLLTMFASDAVETASIPAGQIGVIVGLKQARTGDTLISYHGGNLKTGPPAPLNDLQLSPIDVPPPVFFASVEPHSLSTERHLRECLDLLLREDPSLQVSVDEDSGQTLLKGMGELHLEIAKDRLVNSFKAKAEVGQIEIGYRECIQHTSSPQHIVYEKEVAGKKGKAGCSAMVGPIEAQASDTAQTYDSENVYSRYRDGNLITIVQITPEQNEDTSDDYNDDPAEHRSKKSSTPLSPLARDSLINGALAALARSPVRAYPLNNTHVTLTFNNATDSFGTETHPSALTSAARMATQAALRSSTAASGTTIMEPVMNVSITVDEASLGQVSNDIAGSRGGSVLSLDAEADTEAESRETPATDLVPIPADKIYAPPDPFAGGGPLNRSSGGSSFADNKPRTILARVPLKEMVGYLKHLRSMTGGRGTFVMSVDRFEKMSKQRERMIFGNVFGGRA
ncbi:MAG: NAPDH-dependent diflavin reductase [Chaenotheca gracillima]|nr:MAG: NAPDH-dependent diflavin reductase [Chaenotheca gracillima]